MFIDKSEKIFLFERVEGINKKDTNEKRNIVSNLEYRNIEG